MTKLETEFTAALLSALVQAETVTGVAEVRLQTQAEREGGVRAVQQMLARGQMTRQFGPLSEKKRLDLTPEALVIQGRFAPLFTDEQVDICLQTLLDAGMF